jgi:hypothetical protein
MRRKNGSCDSQGCSSNDTSTSEEFFLKQSHTLKMSGACFAIDLLSTKDIAHHQASWLAVRIAVL